MGEEMPGQTLQEGRSHMASLRLCDLRNWYPVKSQGISISRMNTCGKTSRSSHSEQRQTLFQAEVKARAKAWRDTDSKKNFRYL